VARRTVADPQPHRSPDPPSQARALRVTRQTTDARPSHSAISIDPLPLPHRCEPRTRIRAETVLNILSFRQVAEFVDDEERRMGRRIHPVQELTGGILVPLDEAEGRSRLDLSRFREG